MLSSSSSSVVEDDPSAVTLSLVFSLLSVPEVTRGSSSFLVWISALQASFLVNRLRIFLRTFVPFRSR